MSKLLTMREAIAELVPDGASVALGLQMEQMIPFAAGHEIIRQKKRDLTLIGPISDILFDQMIAAGCVEAGDCGVGGKCDDGLGLQLSPRCGTRRREDGEHDQFHGGAGPAGGRDGRAISADVERPGQ